MKKITFAYSTDRVDTKPADAKQNRRIPPDELFAIVTSRSFPASYLELPGLALRAYRDGDTAAKQRLSELKKELPYFLASGFCPVHHDDATLEYNGVLQIDADFKTADGDQQAIRVLETIKQLRPTGVLLATLSPSTFGVKILLTTDNLDKDRHRDALQAAIEYLAELLDVEQKQFDKLGASQPVYIPFERTPGQTYFNPNTDPLQITFRQETPTRTTAAIECDCDLVRDAAQYLIDYKEGFSLTDRNYFVAIMYDCAASFGDAGELIAWNILENCAEWHTSNTRKTWRSQWRSVKTTQNGRQATGATIVGIARKNGFSGQSARNTTVLQATAGEYLTDVVDRYHIPLTDVCGKYIVSPTGSGKTTMIAELVRRYSDRRAILVLPLRATIRQFCADHPNAVQYTGDSRQITGDERLLVTTIQSFPALATRVDLRQYDVFFDEAHGLTADTSRPYKLETIRKFHQAARQARSVAYMTGTPLYNFHSDFKDLQRIEIKLQTRVERRALFAACDNVLATAGALIRKSIERDRVPILLLNDKKLKLAEIETALADVGLAILNADRKDDQTFIQITTTGAIPADRQAIVTTTVLREGNSIYDGRAFDFFVVGQFHSSTIAQISARPRNAATVDVYLLRSKNRQTKDRSKFSPWSLARLFEDRATRHCDEYNNRDHSDDTLAVFCEHQLRAAMQTDPVYLDDDGRLQVCGFELSNMVYQQETVAEYQDDRLLARNLRRYGFAIDGEHVADYTGSPVLTRTISVDHDPETKAEIKQARSECRAAAAKAHSDALDALQNAISPAIVVQQAEKANRVPAAFKWAKRLVDVYGLTWQEAIDLLRDTDSGKKYRRLENQICVQLLRTNTAYMKGDRLLAIQLLALYKRLRPGARYTADDLRAILVDVLALDKSIDLEAWRPDPADDQEKKKVNRRAIDLLRVFFDVEESGRPGRRSCPRVREYYLREITKFHGHGFSTKQRKSNVYTETDLLRIETPILTAATVDDCPF